MAGTSSSAAARNRRMIAGFASVARILREAEADAYGSGIARVATTDDERRAAAEASLIEFVRLMWPVAEPGRPFVDGWAIRAIAAHLEAVACGRIQHLLVNCPPGFMKSKLLNVFLPAWIWGPRNRAETRIVSASHADAIAIRDNRLCRNLIASDLYQRLWGGRVRLCGDQNAKTKFENTRTGFKIATHVGGGTGERGDLVALDDPHEIRKADSDALREAARLWFTEVLPSRVQSTRSSIVVIMQRLHEDDISGLILKNKLPFDHLMIPMRFESDRAQPPTRIGWVDPRTREGELAWPERFGSRYVAEVLEPFLTTIGGEFAVAGQLQQRPVPREGGLFRPERITFVYAPPEHVAARARGWDLAASKGRESPWTVGAKLSITAGEKAEVTIEDVVRIQGDTHEVDRLIQATAELDGHAVPQDLPQDPGQAGKVQVSALASLLAGYTTFFSPESGDKALRATPFASQVNAANVRMVRAPWNEALMAEMRVFPMSKWKDQVDALSRAYARVLQASRSIASFGAPVLVTR